MNNPASLPRRGHRLWFLLGVVLLAAGAFTYLNLQSEMDSNIQGLMRVLVMLIALVLSLIWFLFLSRFSWWLKLGGVVVIAGLIFGLKTFTRRDGAADGSGIPRIVWAWTPQHQTAPLPAAKEVAPAHTDIPDVPQFFGPNRDGVVHGAHLDPDWAAHPPKQLWRQPAGLGWGAFSVAGGRAFTLEQRGDDEVITCYDVVTGALVWSHAHPKVRFAEWQGGDGPRSVPTLAGGKVFAMGATGILDCLNAADGSVVWTRNILTDIGQTNLMWAKSNSPLVLEDKIIVTGGEKKDAQGKDQPAPCVMAYQRDNGTPLWTAGEDKSSYASPVLVTLAGKSVVISSNADNLTFHDPATGEVLLTYPWGVPNWPRAAQPLIVPGDKVFISAGYGNGCAMLQIKAGPDGKLAATQLWASHKMKTQFNSVHLYEGHIYGLDDGSLACMDAATGDRLWKDGRFGAGQTLLVDDTVLIQAEKGDILLTAAQPTGYKELGHISGALTSKTWNHPVLAGKYLLVRNDREMACYELPVK